MEYQEAQYIVDYFSRLMTKSELKANKHHFSMQHLGEPGDYNDLEWYNKRKEFFTSRNGISNEPEVLKLLEKGYEEFILKTGKRIKQDSLNQIRINKCSKCNFIARTPYAKQCRKCGNDWHDEIGGEFQFEMTVRITGRPFLFIIGELLSGQLKIGNRIDLTYFELNIVREIKQIEFSLKTVNGMKKEIPSLGIDVDENEEILIKKYLTKSAKKIMILKEMKNGG